jgi:hypothetical protein
MTLPNLPAEVYEEIAAVLVAEAERLRDQESKAGLEKAS